MIWFRRHPSPSSLLSHAESMVDSRTAICAQTAAHIARCPRCTLEVETARRSLGAMKAAPTLEPGRDLRANILLAARSARVLEAKAPPAVIFASPRTVGSVCCLVLVGAVAYFAVPNFNNPNGNDPTSEVARLNASVLSLEGLKQLSAEVEVLHAAVMSPRREPRTSWERGQQRLVRALDDDMEAAVEALKRNPACVRAGRILASNRERMRATLTALYVERSR